MVFVYFGKVDIGILCFVVGGIEGGGFVLECECVWMVVSYFGELGRGVGLCGWCVEVVGFFD